jgi:exodeoxyribonuclease VIII
MNTDIMIDFETLSGRWDGAPVTIGVTKFDPLGNEEQNPQLEGFYRRIDLDSCINLGLRVDDSTVEWWGTQSPEAQEEALGEGTPDNPRLPIETVFDELYKFCWGAKRVWSNGATFDIMMCDYIFGKLGRRSPWDFWQIRDVRTIVDIGIDPRRKIVTQHNAFHDAYDQSLWVQNVYRALKGAHLYDGTPVTPFVKWDKV